MEGIVNGMDTTDWSPNVDKFLDVKYDAETVDEGKALAKEALQAELGLPVGALPRSCNLSYSSPQHCCKSDPAGLAVMPPGGSPGSGRHCKPCFSFNRNSVCQEGIDHWRCVQ